MEWKNVTKKQKIIKLILLNFILSYVIICQPLINNGQKQICEQRTYITQETKCTIRYLTCANKLENKLVKCSRNNCQRHLGNNECSISLDFDLNEQNCYWQCCKSNIFNEKQCKANNQKLKQSNSKHNFIFLIVLLALSGVLVIIVIIFFIKILKCNDKQELLEQKSEMGEIRWKDIKYIDIKCNKCYRYGSNIVTPCNHGYHQQCIIKDTSDCNKKIKCLECPQKILKSIKLICEQCRQKQYKIKLNNKNIFIKTLTEIINEAKIIHQTQCNKTIKQVQTDIRLTSTGSD